MKKTLPQIIAFFVLAAISTVWITSCGSKRPSEDMELKRSLFKLTKHFPEYDDVIIFYEATVEDDAIVVHTTLDKDFYGDNVAAGLDELWHDSEWKEEFLEKMVISHSHLIKLAKSAGIGMCWRFSDDKKRKWFDLRLNSEEADRFLQSANEKAKLAESAHLQLKKIIENANQSLPEDKSDGLSLNNIELQPNLIIYNFEVDENKSSHKMLEGKIISIGKGTMSAILRNGIEGDSLLITASDAAVGVTYRFKGSKTGYIQDYVVLTAKELKNLKGAIDS